VRSLLLLPIALMTVLPARAIAVPERIILVNDTGRDLEIHCATLSKGGTLIAQRVPLPGLLGTGRPVILAPHKDQPLPKGSRTSLNFKEAGKGAAHLVLRDANHHPVAAFTLRIHKGEEASGPAPAPRPDPTCELGLKSLLDEHRPHVKHTWRLPEGVTLEVAGQGL